MVKLGNQIRRRERRCVWVCVYVCKMSLLKHALCWMLIRDNKISIKDLFWTDRIREGQMIERGGHEPARRWKGMGGGRQSTLVCVTEWIIPKTPLSAHQCETLSHRHTHRCSDCVHFNPAVQADNGFLSRLSSSEVSFVLPDRPKQELTDKLATITGPICVITELRQNLAQQAEGLLFQNVSCTV